MDRLGMTVPVAGETMAELPAVLDELAAAGYSDIWTSEVNATDALAPLLMAAERVPRLRLGRIPPHPPRILVAALREGMLRLAGRESDGVVLNWLSPDDTARVVPLVLDGNPDADVVARLFVVTGPDLQTARGLARRMVTA